MRSAIGTVARALEVGELPDGRYVMTTVGTRRVRIRAWLPDDPYPVADVDDWPDEDTPALGLEARCEALLALGRLQVLFQKRIVVQHLVDFLAQLQCRELQQANRLLQLGRQGQML